MDEPDLQLISSLSIFQIQQDESEGNPKQVLDFFQSHITPKSFLNLKSNDKQEVFQFIFKSLFSASDNSDSSIRLSASRALSSFLIKVTPLFADDVQRAFSSTARYVQPSPNVSPLLLSTLSFMSNYLAPPFIMSLEQIRDIYKHFLIDSPNFSEHTPALISTLKNLSQTFMNGLLERLINQIIIKPNRFLIKAAASLIFLNPPFYIQSIFKKESSHFSQLFELFSIIFCQNTILDFDISPIIQIAFDIISNPSSKPIELDSAFQVLSGDSHLTFNFHSLTDLDMISGDLKIKVDPSKFSNRIPFYSLNLPLDLLAPNESDGILLLRAKFQTLGKNNAFSLIKPFLLRPYDDVFSAALKGFCFCVNQNLDQVKLLRKIIFGEHTSWFNSLDVLHLIKVIGYPLPFSSQEETIDLLTHFCESDNEALSNEAGEFIQKNSIIPKLDFFNPRSIQKICPYYPTENNIDIEFLQSTIIKSLEAILLYHDDLNTLSSLFKFLSHSSHVTKMIKQDPPLFYPAIRSALIIISRFCFDWFGFTTNFDSCLIPVIETNPEKNTQKKEKTKDDKPKEEEKKNVLVDLVDKEFHRLNFDIIVDLNNLKNCFPSFEAAINFIFSIPIDILGFSFMNQLIKKISPIYPYHTIQYFLKSWSTFSHEQHISFLDESTKLFMFNSNEELLSTMCLIALKTPYVNQAKLFMGLMQSLSTFSFQCGKNPLPKIGAAHAMFLVFSSHKQSLKDYIKLYKNKDEKNIFINECLSLAKNANIQIDFAKEGIIIEDNPINQIQSESHETKIPFDSLEIAIKRNNIEVIKYELYKILKSDISDFHILDYTFPSYFISEISSFIGEIKSSVFPSDLVYVSKGWGMAVSASISKNPSEILNQLISAEKVSKAEILGLSATIGYANYDKEKIKDFALKLLEEAKSFKRVRIILRLILSITYNRYNIKEDFIINFSNLMNRRIPNIPRYEVCMIFTELFKQIDLARIGFFFVKKLQNLFGRISLFSCYMEQIILSEDVDKWIASFIESPLPSYKLTALRILRSLFQKQGTSEITLKCSKYFLGSIFTIFEQIPLYCEFGILLLIDILQGGQFSSLHQSVIENFSKYFSLSNNDPRYGELMQLLSEIITSNIFIQQYSQSSIGKSALIAAENMFKGPNTKQLFQIALKCLQASMIRLEEIDEEAVINDAMITWRESLKQYDNYYTVFLTIQWIFILRSHRDERSTFSMIAQTFGRPPQRFFPTFTSLILLYQRYYNEQNEDWIFSNLEVLRTVRTQKCQQIAIKLLIESKGDPEKIKLALECATFEIDSPFFQQFAQQHSLM